MQKKAAGFLFIICFFLAPLWAQSEDNKFEGEPRAEANRFEDEPGVEDDRFAGEPRTEENRFAGEPRAEANRFEDEPETWEAVLDVGQEEEEEKEEEKKAEPVPRPKRDPRIKSRFFELSLVNINDFGFANSFIATDDIFYNPFKMLFNLRDIIQHFRWDYIIRPEIEIDLDEFFEDGLVFGFGTGIKPVSININWKDKWGFGLDLLHIDATGSISFPGDVLSLKETSKKDVNFGVGAAVFADVGIPVFFHANELKVKFRPAVYAPLAYLEPDIKYSYTGTRVDIKYNIRLYTPVKFGRDEQDNISGIEFNGLDTVWDILNNNLGYDFNLGFEYPLYPNHLDIGIDFFNIPLYQAKVDNYLYLENEVWFDYGNIDINTIIAGEEFDINDLYYFPTDYSKIKSGSSSRGIFRPFKMIAYGIWQPFETKYFTLIPKVGFSINKLYATPAAFEGGLGACFDINNCFITTLGIHYMDHKWKNSIDWILNLKVLQIDFGLIFQSQDFVQSWRGAGFALNFGLKIGF